MASLWSIVVLSRGREEVQGVSDSFKPGEYEEESKIDDGVFITAVALLAVSSRVSQWTSASLSSRAPPEMPRCDPWTQGPPRE